MHVYSTRNLPAETRETIRNWDRLFPRTSETTYRGDRNDAADLDDDDFLGEMARTLNKGKGGGPKGLSGKARRERIERRKAKGVGA